MTAPISGAAAAPAFRAHVTAWSAELRTVALPFAVSRTIAVAGTVIGTSLPSGPAQGGSSGLAGWLGPWTAFDGAHYLDIALHGYSRATATFFPLTPAVLRLGGHSATTVAAWGIGLNTACLLAAMALLLRVTRRRFGAAAAQRAVWVLALFPTGFVFSSVYSDSVFLLLGLATWYCWSEGMLWRAAAFGLLAGLTRNVGAVLALALAVSWLESRQRSRPMARVAAVVGPAAGVVAFELWLAIAFHEPLVGVTGHQAYGRVLMAPWMPVLMDLRALPTSPMAGIVAANLVALALGGVLAWRHRADAGRAVFVLGVLAMQLTYGRLTVPHLNGTLRFLSTAFPFLEFVALATLRSARPRSRGAILLGVAAASLAFAFALEWGKRSFVSG